MAPTPRRAAVLFDVDGTLVDSTYLHTVSWWQAFRRADHDVSSAIVHRAIGMGADQLVPHVLDRDVDDDEIGALTSAHDAVYATHWPALRALPGARDLVRRCKAAGLTTVLASSAAAAEVSVIRELLDVDDALDEVTSSEDAEHSKPSPDLVQTALERAGTERAVFVGDATPDVDACARAGIDCIALECGGTSAAELREAGAVEIYRDPADLLSHWDDTAIARLLG